MLKTIGQRQRCGRGAAAVCGKRRALLARPSQMMIRAGAVLLASLAARPTDAGKLSNGAPPAFRHIRAASPAAAPSRTPATVAVLMLAVDDLRPIGKVFGEPKVLTLDKLASESVVFENAWVQCATCVTIFLTESFIFGECCSPSCSFLFSSLIFLAFGAHFRCKLGQRLPLEPADREASAPSRPRAQKLGQPASVPSGEEVCRQNPAIYPCLR